MQVTNAYTCLENVDSPRSLSLEISTLPSSYKLTIEPSTDMFFILIASLFIEVLLIQKQVSCNVVLADYLSTHIYHYE